MRQGLRIALAVGAAALAAAPAALAGQRPRPTDVPAAQVVTDVAPDELRVYNDFATPARVYRSQYAVVHYVVLGVDAPPLNDDDLDAVPDYVERVGSAADTALAYFARRGFAAILPDTGGPDGRPDIYVSRFAPGYLGVAFPAARAQGGAFVVVSNALDPSAGRSFASLYGTVAHELFHLTQFSYFRPTVDPPIPGWALEGSAAAMEARVYPELVDTVASLQLRHWFAAPHRSLAEQTYGAQLLWRYLDEREPRVLPAYLARLASSRPPRSAVAGLADTYGRVAGRPFRVAFGRFAAWIADEYAERITPRATLRPGARRRGRVSPLAIDVLRLAPATRSVTLRLSQGHDEAGLIVRLESAVAGRPPVATELRPRVGVGGARVYALPSALRRDAYAGTATLVVANGDASSPLVYALSVR
ncbi:MAG: hypothetical protein ACM33B_04335 [Pseudomonadota bacterium]